MWEVPHVAVIVKGVAHGTTELTAFDKALLSAGIGNLNLVKVSSIIPPNTVVVRQVRLADEVPAGAIVPAVYSHITSDRLGQTIASAIAIGTPKDSNLPGVIFESSLIGNACTAVDRVRKMTTEAMRVRGTLSCAMIEESCELVVQKAGEFACVLTAVVFLRCLHQGTETRTGV